MENNKAFTLTALMVKLLFFSPKVLVKSLLIQKNRNDFLKGKAKKDVILLVLLGKKLYDVISRYKNIVFGFQFGKQKFSSFGVPHDWVK